MLSYAPSSSRRPPPPFAHQTLNDAGFNGTEQLESVMKFFDNKISYAEMREKAG